MGKVYLTLDTYLQSRGISRYAVAKKSGIRYETINKYYRSRVERFDGYVLAKLCETLDCELSEILRYRRDTGKE